MTFRRSGRWASLCSIIWLITLFSTYFFVAKTWWLPHGASTAAAFIDHHFALTYVLMGIVFLAAQGRWAVGVEVSRPAGQKVEYSHGNTTMEVIWTPLTAILFIGLNLLGSSSGRRSAFAGGAGSVPVEVTGMQFAWYFRYPGPDGKFGPTKPKLMDASAGNPRRHRHRDPASRTTW